MKKILFVISIILVFAVGCIPKASDMTSEELKPLAEEDFESAEMIANALIDAFTDQKILTEEKDQELIEENNLGKILLEYKYIDYLPEPVIQEGYRFYVSISQLGSVTVKSGESPEKAIRLYPRPGSFKYPYSVLNIE